MKREAATSSESEPLDVSKLEPVWVGAERAKLGRQLQNFLKQYPTLQVKDGRLVSVKRR